MKKTNFLNYLVIIAIFILGGCSNVDEPEEPTSPAQSLPFIETFEQGFGKFTTQNVLGDQVWEYSPQYKYVKITGYVDGTKENHANEDWLISPEIDLSNVTAAKLTFEHVIRNFANPATEATLWVSENYIDGLPSTATWTQLTTPLFTNFSDWTFGSSGEISLTPYAGKKIRIAFKYISTDIKAGTWEIKNFKVEEGEAATPPADTPTGEGTEISPYNVIAAIQNQGNSKWVTGYIVGNIDGSGISITTESKFTPPFTVKTNLLIADSPTETDYKKCLPVQLPAGAVRNGLNLVDKPANLGKKVKLYGSLETYFGVPGLKSCSYFELEDGTSGGTKPSDTSGAIFSETFANSQGDFTIVDVIKNPALPYIWTHDDSYKYMKASAYANSTNYESESWLISPAINLSGETNVTLNFEHTIGPAPQLGIDKSHFTVWASNNYSTGNPNEATWTKLDLSASSFNTTTPWTFVPVSLTIPSQYLTSNVRIAFKYTSTNTASATWEVKNVVVK
ncbi:MAG: choice-of-anchor J domain-containing protein [Paludibacteraceae bacterium]|nr:choice-of-anchor J domain-containing protein [Paludibacteraceae bacterium]